MAVKKDMMRNWRPMVQRTPLAPRQFMVAFEWKDIDGKLHTASAWARRNNDQMVEAAFEVALTGEMLRTAAERMKILPNLGRETRDYIERYLTPLPQDDESVFITANAASLIVGITKTKKLDLREPGPSAYAMFRLKTKTGEVTIDKLGEHDEIITNDVPVDIRWPKESPFKVGRRVHGSVSQATTSDFVMLRRTSTGNRGERAVEGPETTRDGVCELLRRLTVAGIGVTQVVSTPKNLPEAELSVGCLPARSSSLDATNYAKKLLAAQDKYAPSPDSAFRLVTDATSFERVVSALNAKPEVSKSAWPELAQFAFEHGWSSHSSDRLTCNVILEGVPGTGKTYALKELAETMENAVTIATGPFATTMHPATSYEDFVEGLRPGAASTFSGTAELDAAALKEAVATATVGASGWFFEPMSTKSQSDFQLHDGFFVAACAAAVRNPSTPYVVLLDELNRCNIPKVMGDLITTMEVSKRAKWNAATKQWDLSSAQVVTLPYSKRQFFVPDNLSIVGTMNTTDRSVAPMDAALRRRFVFVRVEPELDHKDLKHVALRGPGGAQSILKRLNDALEAYLGGDAILGHSYLFDLQTALNSAASEHHDAVTAFTFNSVIFPMVVDTLVNNGCLAELAEAKDSKNNAPAAEFRRKVEEIANWSPSGRGMTQTLKLTWPKS